MSITRGEFLKSLRKSIPGMVLGGGVATAAHKILDKMAAVSGAMENPSPTSVAAKPETAKESKIEFITSGPVDGKRIALTFDDGPTPGVTDRILDELKQRNLRATFFMIGERIAAAPDLARRVLAEGHEVGNHTYTHPNLTKLPDAEVEAEIQKTQDVIREALDHRPAWFRPPYGALRQDQAGMVTTRGMGIVICNVDSRDWARPGEAEIIRKVLAETTAGSIILCHDMHQQTADGAGRILDGLLERGFSLETLSALLG
jgi:peptidoglycan/xylan/chitin deacetylase (PgdA/CDA1 family)